MSNVNAQQNETFRECMRCRERDTSPVKTNGWKIIDPFNKVGNVTSKS